MNVSIGYQREQHWDFLLEYLLGIILLRLWEQEAVKPMLL